ncbi:MAG: long-chain N-acyl amino acid synthase [Pirellulales bacterium]|nr:long-chain N-acyl amino acid synthase [Pirellulales bacterium]
MNIVASHSRISERTDKKIELKIASTREEREAAFALIYQNYLQAGLCEPNPTGLRITPYQLLTTTDIFVAKLQGEVISTLSLVRDGEYGLPMELTYTVEVAERRRKGLRLAEITCLADRRRGSERFFNQFCELCRLLVQYAVKQEIDQLLVAVHPRHAKIYCRYMAFTQIGGCCEYSVVRGSPAVALCLDLKQIQINRPANWARFFAQKLPDEVLISQPISDVDRRYFIKLQTEMETMETIPYLPARSYIF